MEGTDGSARWRSPPSFPELGGLQQWLLWNCSNCTAKVVGFGTLGTQARVLGLAPKWGGGVTYDPDIPRLKHFVKKAIPKINHCFLLWQPFSFTVLRVSMLCSLFVTTCKEKVCGCNNVLFDLLKKKYHPKFEGFSLRNYMPINMLKKLDVCYI